VNLPGLTASQFVKTDGSKNLVSVAGIIRADLALTDIATANVSTAMHGFAPKLPTMQRGSRRDRRVFDTRVI
jgi:hypothetical protein